MNAGTASPTTTGGDSRGQPQLRLVSARCAQRHAGEKEPRERGCCADRVLVAGADPAARARMLSELRSLLPADTDFREAGETWEVIAQACDSRMVVLAGDVGSTSSSALLRLLARRNPSLPVLVVGDRQLQAHRSHGLGPSDGDYRPTVDTARA